MEWSLAGLFVGPEHPSGSGAVEGIHRLEAQLLHGVGAPTIDAPCSFGADVGFAPGDEIRRW